MCIRDRWTTNLTGVSTTGKRGRPPLESISTTARKNEPVNGTSDAICERIGKPQATKQMIIGKSPLGTVGKDRLDVVAMAKLDIVDRAVEIVGALPLVRTAMGTPVKYLREESELTLPRECRRRPEMMVGMIAG